MNYSIYSADRATHLKIVVVAMLAAIAVSGLSLSLHYRLQSEPSNRIAMFKAGKPMAVSSSAMSLVR